MNEENKMWYEPRKADFVDRDSVRLAYWMYEHNIDLSSISRLHR